MADCKSSPVDLLFMVDASEKGQENWNLMTTFIKSVVSQFSIGAGDTRVGMITFSDRAQVRIKLNEYYTVEEFTNAIVNPSFYGGEYINISV